ASSAVSCLYSLVKVLGADHTLSDEDGDHAGGVVAEAQGGLNRLRDVIGIVSAIDVDARRFECVLRRLAHCNLPRIEFAPLAAHGDEHDDGHATFVLQ